MELKRAARRCFELVAGRIQAAGPNLEAKQWQEIVFGFEVCSRFAGQGWPA
jgi:hypothetical protein